MRDDDGLDTLLAALRRGDSFFVGTHVSPDGDAVGRALPHSAPLRTTLRGPNLVYERTIPT